ncbi:MAG: putative zinc-binding metallopeptidase, partial [Opitutaceae bacterium]
MDQAEWANLDDAQLLEWPIRKLGLSVENSALQPFVQQLYDELSGRGLVFHPPCHLGDEWFVPVGIPAVFIPFFLVHDRLRELERKLFLDVEGETPETFMKLIRHEAGHAYSYAFGLYKRRKWQETFGLASTEDTGFYRPRPYSRSYVVHLDDWYAQAHPDEDFAETFAVWMTPGLDWRERYRGWKALHKLERVDALMKSIAGKPPKHQPEYRPVDYDCLGLKLKTFYARKRKLYEDTYPDFYDADLRAIFPQPSPPGSAIPASTWLRRNKRPLMN